MMPLVFIVCQEFSKSVVDSNHHDNLKWNVSYCDLHFQVRRLKHSKGKSSVQIRPMVRYNLNAGRLA